MCEATITNAQSPIWATRMFSTKIPCPTEHGIVFLVLLSLLAPRQMLRMEISLHECFTPSSWTNITYRTICVCVRFRISTSLESVDIVCLRSVLQRERRIIQIKLVHSCEKAYIFARPSSSLIRIAQRQIVHMPKRGSFCVTVNGNEDLPFAFDHDCSNGRIVVLHGTTTDAEWSAYKRIKWNWIVNGRV